MSNIVCESTINNMATVRNFDISNKCKTDPANKEATAVAAAATTTAATTIITTTTTAVNNDSL
jgi:hypothetical protein